MSYQSHVRCLKVIALAQLFFDHMMQPVLTAGLKCPFLKAVTDVDWNKLEGQEWLEAMNYPNMEEVCPVMRFFPSNETMTLQARTGPTGTLSGPRFFKFRKSGVNKWFTYAHDEKFYQLLDTDYESWALFHHCWEGGTGSWFIIGLRKPMSEVPANIMQRIEDSLKKSGNTVKVRWNRSGCMLKKLTVGADVEFKKTEPADKLSLVDGLAPKKTPADKLSLVDGLSPEKKAEASPDKLSLVNGPAP